MTEKEIVDLLIFDSLIRTIKSYGLEGTLEAISRVYDKMPIVKKRMLNCYWRLLRKEENNGGNKEGKEKII